MEKIQVNELRLGNLIYSNSSNCLFNKGIFEVDFDTFKKIQLYNALQHLEGIPLTEEWLLNFGFNNDDKIHIDNYDDCLSIWENKEWIGSYEDGFYLVFIGADYDEETSVYQNSEKIEYVHQLQNIFYCLSGKELKTKNPTE